MSFNLYSFPCIDSYYDTENDASDACNTYSSYPFFDNNDNANPNLIGVSALLSSDNGGIVCSYNYLCPYNILATYTGNTIVFSICPNIKHMIINNGEMVISGKDLPQYITSSSAIFSVEYITENFSAITSIDDNVFYEAKMTTVRLPYNNVSGVTIGNNSFGETSLIEFYCYHTLKSVGNSAFQNCYSLIGNEISCNGKIALVYNNDELKLADTNLSNCLKVCFDCGVGSFYGCSSLSSVTFYDIHSYDSVYISQPTGNTLYQKANKPSMEHDTENMTPFPFYSGYSGETSGYTIGNYAFQNCSGLKKIGGYVINVSIIYGYAKFNSCEYVSVRLHHNNSSETYAHNMIIPRSVRLGKGCFQGCTSLGNNNPDDSVLYFENPKESGIPEDAFLGCSGITGLGMSSRGDKIDADNIGTNAFKGTGIDPQNAGTELEKIASSVDEANINRIFGL